MTRALLISLLAIAVSGAANAGEITVNVTGLKTKGLKTKGLKTGASNIYAAACEKKHFLGKTFLADCIAVTSVPATGKTATVVLENVPEGRFAVMVFQDVNGNGKLDFSLVGAPAEPGGFSGPDLQVFPGFEDSALNVGAVAISISVKLRCLFC